MATLTDHGDLLHDPAAMLEARERYALVTMEALASIMQNGKDDKAKVAAAAEMNRMLSLGILNRGGSPRAATQVNNIRLTPQKGDTATQKLLERFAKAPSDDATPIDGDMSPQAVSDTLEALSYDPLDETEPLDGVADDY